MKSPFASTRSLRPSSSHRGISFKTVSVAGIALMVAASAHAIDIQVTYDAALTADTASMATIQSAINFLDTHYTGSSVVRIGFHNTSDGLGTSVTSGFNLSYSSYHTALTNNSSGNAVDTAALAQLTALPFTGSTIGVSTALARHLGLADASGDDSNIFLNTSICFTGHSAANAAAHPDDYDLYAVVLHEVDEVLGSVSGIPNESAIGPNDPPSAEDLFRYQSANVRNFSEDTSKHVFLSVDGTNMLTEYNHFGRTDGDWGDFATGTTAQVQDAFGNPGQVVDYGVNETTMLDAVGWNVQAAPEPSTIAGLGVAGLLLLRRRKKA